MSAFRGGSLDEAYLMECNGGLPCFPGGSVIVILVLITKADAAHPLEYSLIGDIHGGDRETHHGRI